MTELNAEQRRAVEHGEGPLLVIAGPGSGKTSVIVERILHLLEKAPGLAPENILALTYTEKAAAEMGARVRRALVGSETAPHVSTFHSFCLTVLQQRRFERRLLDPTDIWIFLRRRMEMLGLDHYQKLASPGAFLHDLNEFFSRCQDELIEPEDFEGFAAQVEKAFERRAAALDPAARQAEAQALEKLKELARVFAQSRRLMEDAGCSSFGSLVSETVRLWDREPDVLETFRRRFRYVLVDEFQDTNYGQVELLRRLADRPHNITAVGDDDQAIYRFRGAAHGAFTMFRKSFPGAETVYLNRNYRSTKKILRVAEAVISKNQREVSKPALTTNQEEGACVGLLVSPDGRSEAAGVAGLIEDLARQGRAYHDIAVLYRAHSHRDLLVEDLRRRNVPFAIRGLSLLSTVILRDLIAYLRLIHSWQDNISLTRVLLAPRWRFPEALAMEARRRAAKNRCPLAESLGGMGRSLFHGELESTGWPELRAALNDLRTTAEIIPVSATLDKLLDRLEVRFLPGESDDLYVQAFKKFLKGWEEKSETRALGEFIEYFDYFIEAGGKIESPADASPSNAVQMMTVHAAKGLEFPVVIVLGVGSRRFPHRQQKPVIEFPEGLRKGPPPPADISLEEERRLFFVAITRAQQQLYISSLAGPGKKPSRFVEDVLSDAAIRIRDLQTFEVPAVKEATPTPRRPAPSPSRQERDGQSRLFEAAGADSLHPPVAEWAAADPPCAGDGLLQLSATAIETYLDCPLKFKFSHALKIPTGPQAALTFGNVMHQSIRRYFELRRQKPPTVEEMEEFYLSTWKSAGFEDDYQEAAYQRTGRDQLRAFVERQNAAPIEGENVRTEQAFQLEVDDVLLEGRIDQINPLDSARSNRVELVDYKTGRPRTQKDADHSLQLSIYALAARRQFKLDPARLTFYNLTNNQPVWSVRTEKDLEAARARIREVADAIRRLIFPATPGYVCRHCDYVPICPAHEEEF
jgi:DNA helicase-2/ATP-dependent DNA helicase PcrA